MSIKGYDQWKTASPADEGTATELIEFGRKVFEKAVSHYGRPQHGLNGKDADLDSGGQIVVKEVQVLDEVKRLSHSLMTQFQAAKLEFTAYA